MAVDLSSPNQMDVSYKDVLPIMAKLDPKWMFVDEANFNDQQFKAHSDFKEYVN